MENLRKLNYVVSGGVNENHAYIITLASYGDKALCVQKVNDFVEHLEVSGYLNKTIETNVIEIPREYIEKDAIGELKMSGISKSDLNYKIENESYMLTETMKALEEFKNKKTILEREKEEHNLKLKNTAIRLENLKIKLELKTKLASLL